MANGLLADTSLIDNNSRGPSFNLQYKDWSFAGHLSRDLSLCCTASAGAELIFLLHRSRRSSDGWKQIVERTSEDWSGLSGFCGRDSRASFLLLVSRSGSRIAMAVRGLMALLASVGDLLRLSTTVEPNLAGSICCRFLSVRSGAKPGSNIEASTRLALP